MNVGDRGGVLVQVHELVDRNMITLHTDDSIERLVEVLSESSQDLFPVVEES